MIPEKKINVLGKQCIQGCPKYFFFFGDDVCILNIKLTLAQ